MTQIINYSLPLRNRISMCENLIQTFYAKSQYWNMIYG